ncbi:MAG: hypothetical protein A2029_09060 [Chloroflexi bacterium RBG_19FT_COMBO_47_9]|nr:MAG: hypothetical protein A2029_09060 [Chloroflexi bacterium RBG_19FT_COMBO_47_9]
MHNIMKKIFTLILLVGMLFVFIALFQTTQKAMSANTRGSLEYEEQNAIEQVGPPWDGHESWKYRIPVIINSGAYLPWYQVLLTLDNSNFNFSQAKPDGSDIRFTHSDGTTEINYWIESWNNSAQLAYVWVKVPGVAGGDTTIYLYYNNPNAAPLSNGPGTFDSFDDDWCDFPGAGCLLSNDASSLESLQYIDSPFVWSVISGSPSVTPTIPGYLNIWEGAGIKSYSTYLYRAVGYKANFGLGGEYERGGFFNHVSGTGTMIGDDCPGTPGDLFLINSGNCSQFSPPENWHDSYHVYEIRWINGQSYGDIDHGEYSASSSVQVPNSSLPVTLYSYLGSNATLTVDWVYVRQYRNPEPTVSVGTAQGLAELAIGSSDTPDPVRGNQNLTYQLTISNTNSIGAPSVIVTDTLPGEVIYVSAIPSQGSCNGEIICNLGTIPANSTAGITINVKVKSQINGTIINNAVVGSLFYDLNISDNANDQATFVDSILPTVEWIKPIGNRQTYVTTGGLILLEVLADDNDQIDRVEFWLYTEGDPDPWENFAKIYASPYQFLFDSDTLLPNKEYPIEAYAFDRAGNQNPLDEEHRQVIRIERIIMKSFYLPLLIR